MNKLTELFETFIKMTTEKFNTLKEKIKLLKTENKNLLEKNHQLELKLATSNPHKNKEGIEKNTPCVCVNKDISSQTKSHIQSDVEKNKNWDSSVVGTTWD